MLFCFNYPTCVCSVIMEVDQRSTRERDLIRMTVNEKNSCITPNQMVTGVKIGSSPGALYVKPF